MEEQTEELTLEQLLTENSRYQAEYQTGIDRAVSSARAEWELQSRQRESQLRQELAEQLAQGEAELAQRRQEFEKRLCQAAAGETLQRLGLDAAFAPWLGGGNMEESQARAEQFAAFYHQSLAQAVSDRMRSENVPREPEQGQGITRENLRMMSPKEINRNWETVAGILRECR